MTVQINGTTGINHVQPGTVQQTDLASNVVGNGPAFRVYAASTVTALSTTDAKINFDTKSDSNGFAFDTDNSFNLSTDGFQPKVAGYYLLSALISGSNGTSQLIASFRKNNSIFTISTQVATAARIAITDLVYLNGTTDYVELFGFSSPAQNTIVGTATYFSGFLVRAA
jgi:hypothetical protein